jgi:hypothetical protein
VLRFGKHSVFPIDVLNNAVPITKMTRNKILNNRDTQSKNYAKKHIQKGKKTKKEIFKPGDLVLVYIKKPKGKFEQEWIPGFTILSAISLNAYSVLNGKSVYRLGKKHIRYDTSLKKGDVVSINKDT